MNYRVLKIIALLFIVFVSCSPPPRMYRRGGMLYHEKREKIVRTAKRYIGIDYRWGGTTQFGFDCSGFVQHVYKKNGISIPRGSRDQYLSGRRIALQSAEPGDLVFFRTSGNRISHVGIYLGNKNFIHAPSEGKEISYASIDNPYWRKRYVGAATFF